MKIQHKSDYVAKRKEAYPSLEDQLDTIYHEGIDVWKERITEIKERYPKPEADQ